MEPSELPLEDLASSTNNGFSASMLVLQGITIYACIYYQKHLLQPFQGFWGLCSVTPAPGTL